jgi:pimeloyl-ACP methyl ester carboxylesterase
MPSIKQDQTAKKLSRRTFGSGLGQVVAASTLGAGFAQSALTKTALAAADQLGDKVRVRRAYADGLDGLQIHYRYAGPRQAKETPLMCLHASPLSGILYDYWLAEMGRDRFVVAPDTPGYGGSDTPAKPPLIGDLADAMIAFMDSIGLSQVDVMGYHTGSFTSADLAMRYPDRIRKVVMISAPIFDQAIIDEYSSRIYDPPPKLADVLVSNGESLKKNPRGMFRDVPTDERYADISIERLRHYRTGNWGFRAAFAYDLTKTLPNVDQPILVLNPEDDLWDQTPRAMPYIKTGRKHDLPGWTHGALDTHTEEIAAIVRAFLAE